MRKIILGFVAVVAVGFLGFYFLRHDTSTTNKQTTSSTSTTKQSSTGTKTTSDGFNKSQYSLTDPTSIWVVVNKQLPLNPKTHVPPDLVVPTVPLRVPGNETMKMRQVTATALEALFAAAKTANVPMMVSSGYRSYSFQVSLYNGYVQSQGQATADTQSARPGFSEHQTGLAVDVEPADGTCNVDQCFANTAAGKWLAANAYKYGFIIRYPQGLESVTGYEYEPWHVRYVGIPLATEMHNDGIQTLEQFFGLGSAANYN